MAPPAPLSQNDRLAPLRVPDFRRLLGSLFATTLGTQIQATAVAYQVYALTRDPLSLGLVGLAEALPFISLALLGGHFADVWDRRRVALAALAGHLLCGLALVAVSAAGAGLDVTVQKLAIYAIIGGTGVARSFFQPARNALAADVVPRELYPAAVTFRTGAHHVALVLGPAVGGLAYGFLGPTATYVLAAALVLVGIVGVSRVQAPAPERSPGPRPAIFASLREGIAFLRGDEVLLAAITLDLFAVLFGGATALLPIFANEILQLGAREFGFLRAAPAAGAVVMSVLLAFRPPLARAGVTLLGAVAVFGLCMIGFALSRSLLLSLALLAVSGAADMVSVVVRGTLMQTRVPRQMLGRMAAINQVFIGSSNEIGAFESGVAARLLGAVRSVVLGGSVTLAVVAITAWRAPGLRRLRRLTD